MRRKEPLPEYEPPDSSAITLRSSTVAAIQQIVGGLVLPYTEPEAPDIPDDAEFSPIASPVELGRVLGARATSFKEAVEGWKKQMTRLVSSKPARPASQAAALLKNLERIETDCLHLPALLRQVRSALEYGLQCMKPGSRVYLGVPSPIPEEDLREPSSALAAALDAAGALTPAQDADLPLLAARSVALTDEILVTLREAGKIAKWLWTNQPVPDKLTELIQWVWDLHCECQEMATCCGCLKSGIQHWVAAPPPQP